MPQKKTPRPVPPHKTRRPVISPNDLADHCEDIANAIRTIEHGTKILLENYRGARPVETLQEIRSHNNAFGSRGPALERFARDLCAAADYDHLHHPEEKKTDLRGGRGALEVLLPSAPLLTHEKKEKENAPTPLQPKHHSSLVPRARNPRGFAIRPRGRGLH